EIVARANGRVDVLELVGRAPRSPLNGPETAQVRQFWWDGTQASGWFDTGRTVTNNLPETLNLSCTSWGSERIDCFVAPDWLDSAHMPHTYYYFSSQSPRLGASQLQPPRPLQDDEAGRRPVEEVARPDRLPLPQLRVLLLRPRVDQEHRRAGPVLPARDEVGHELGGVEARIGGGHPRRGPGPP